jgi:hypothetical protein
MHPEAILFLTRFYSWANSKSTRGTLERQLNPFHDSLYGDPCGPWILFLSRQCDLSLNRFAFDDGHAERKLLEMTE